MENNEDETSDKKLNISDVSSGDIKGYGGKKFDDMDKEELIVIVKHLCSVLKKIQKMDEEIDKKIIKTINSLRG